MITEPSIPNGFESRHIGPSPQDVSAMLQTIGVSSLDGLIAQTVPDDIRQRSPQYPAGSVTHHHDEPDHLAFLERPFHEAIEAIHRRMNG